jgi:Tfp pilus assembly protein PilX
LNKVNPKNNKGFILIVSYMVITVLVILGVGLSSSTISEQRVAHKEKDLIQAFWIAEAGLDNAISNLSEANLSGTLETGKYFTETAPTSNPVRYLITSTGGVPDTDKTDPNNAVRIIKAVVEQPVNEADPSGITSAITASGDVTVKGSAEVNGDIDDNAVVDFEEIFGISKEAMEDNAVYLYTDPENNVDPVNNLTWTNIVSEDEMRITDDGWTGGGILIVNGNLRITGGYFRGIIWVIGTLWVSGNPIIDGTVFVESGAEFETTITGNPTVSYDTDAISDAFNYLPSGLPPFIVSWKEE